LEVNLMWPFFSADFIRISKTSVEAVAQLPSILISTLHEDDACFLSIKNLWTVIAPMDV